MRRETACRLLGVSEGASKREIKRAYEEIGRRYQPIVDRSPRAMQEWGDIQTAFSTLYYDKQMSRRDFLAGMFTTGAAIAGVYGYKQLSQPARANPDCDTVYDPDYCTPAPTPNRPNQNTPSFKSTSGLTKHSYANTTRTYNQLYVLNDRVVDEYGIARVRSWMDDYLWFPDQTDPKFKALPDGCPDNAGWNYRTGQCSEVRNTPPPVPTRRPGD